MKHRERLWLENWSEWSRRILIAAAMGALVLAGKTVLAGEPVVWSCWFEAGQYYVYCDATRPLPPAQLAALGEASGLLQTDGEPLATVPASLDTAGIARTANSQWRFPLHTIPRDMERVRTLARSLLCGAAPECRVVFADLR